MALLRSDERVAGPEASRKPRQKDRTRNPQEIDVARQPKPLSSSDISSLIEALGEAPKLSYAPPNLYPMSVPVFDAADGLTRDPQPSGPIGIYVHVPFCNYKCAYCFYSTKLVPDVAEMTRYVEAVEKELDWVCPGSELSQLYVGGGTPTALPPELLDRLLDAIFARVVPGREVNTVECSPESITEDHVRVLGRHGIERVSMGVQSADEQILVAMNRRHSNADVMNATELLLDAGIMVNIDLIYGLPGQTQESFRADFELAAKRGVHSLTTYNLRINEMTPIGRQIGDAERLDAARLVRWRELARDVAQDCGFRQTRWHTYQRANPTIASDAAGRFRDVTGWGNQFGVGVSARSRLNDKVYRNQKHYADYLKHMEEGRSPVEEMKPLDADERRLRYVTLTLGDGRGLDREAYQEIFGNSFDDDFGETTARLVAAGLIVDEQDELKLTRRGRLFYDLTTRSFYPKPLRRWMEGREKLLETSVNLRPRAN